MNMISKARYVALSDFRSRLSRFLRLSERSARDAGLQPAQYLLLLHLRGMPGRDWATIGELAERLDASHQGAVALVQRCVRNGLLVKRRSEEDARRVELRLTAKGKAAVERVASVNRNELARLLGVLRRA